MNGCQRLFSSIWIGAIYSTEGMESGSIVEALDESKEVALGLGAGLVLAMMDELCPQRV